ncbi:hypothetical protein EW026_g3879 [Hermanssonia centrifuga]|uniref:Aip3p/Bud6 N-terminal domain-containing protein n=1 Tax=Hermanssonia centrifuga TaxID=98765 RepID=A0A4S4KNH7_9APHY|nr:hypothetical protein EW026_g3879 [Hermanssonia centrifuga]
MYTTTSISPIYYVGQPKVMRASQGAAWFKSSPLFTMQTAVRSQYKPSSPPPSDVPTAVSTLLGLTKQLQDVLRLWSVYEASEAQVSDAFVLVGMQFNATVTAFNRHGIDMSDLSHIPTDLRSVLEQCLGKEPSQRVLSRYMPKVRTVLYHLLQGLQRKQAPYWKAVEGSRWVVPDEFDRYH